MEKIIIGSDHAGYELKEHLKDYIRKNTGYEVVDFGCYSPEPVDYPDIAYLVAEAVAKSNDALGIVIDGVGSPSAIVANKVPGIRASVCWDLFTARISREHNDANILALGGRVLGKTLAEEIVKVWLATPFAGGRHKRRVDKIINIEGRYLKNIPP